MAALRKRGETYQLNWYEQGKKRAQSLGKVSRKEAENHLKLKEAELLRSQIDKPKIIAFDQLCYDYCIWHQAEHPSSTKRVQQIITQHLVPYFGHFSLDAIKIKEAEAYKRRRMTKVKSATILKELRTLKAILNKAIEWEFIDKSPISHLKMPKILDSKTPRFYTAEELQTIYQWAPYNWHWWRFMANTGIRRGETLLLQNSWIGKDEMKIESSEKARTKSGKWREIPLNESAKYCIDRFNAKGKFLFPQVHEDSITRAFNRVLYRADIEKPKGSVHCLRHTFCSHLVMDGKPLRLVQRLAGHAKFETTERYVHLSPEYRREMGVSIEL